MIAVYARWCRTAWAGSCTSWYKTDEGKIVNYWSTDTVRYWRRTRRPRLALYILRRGARGPESKRSLEVLFSPKALLKIPRRPTNSP